MPPAPPILPKRFAFKRGTDGMTGMPNTPAIGAGQLKRDADAEADDNGVNALACAMKSKLAAKRAEGYGGWNKPDDCAVEHLAKLLLDHLPKGDPVDIANFAMMLFNREGGAEALRVAAAIPADELRSPEDDYDPDYD